MADTLDRDDASPHFADAARAAGLRLPAPRRFGLSWTIFITAIIVGASIGVGFAVGWLNPILPVRPTPELAGAQDCGAAAVPLSVATEENTSGSLAPAWNAMASSFASSTGGCLSVTSSGSGFGALASDSVDGLVGPELPSPLSGSPLATSTYAVPLLVSPVVLIVNLGATPRGVNLTASALAGIFLGTVSSWGSPALTGPNPGLRTSLSVALFTLAAGAPANEAICTYLSEWNSTARSRLACGAGMVWPVGTPMSSPVEIVSAVATTPGAVGYVPTDVCSSLPLNVSCAALQTGGPEAGYARADLPDVEAAAAEIANSTPALQGDWSNVTAVVPTNSSGYPIVELTYGIVYADLGTAYGSLLSLDQAKWLVTLLWWVTVDSGPTAGGFGYLPLPSTLATTAQTILVRVAYLGTSILEPPGEENGESGGETGEF